MQTVAEALADELYNAGIRTIFGLPGGETVEVLDAARRRGIDFQLVHSESSALFMADAVSRVGRGPAAALTTLGPGATNALAGVAHAYLDRAPIVFITAQKPDDLLPDYTHQVLDLHALFAPITKATVALRPDNCDQIGPTIALTTRGRPGPVHLQVSNEDAASPIIGSIAPVSDDVDDMPVPSEAALARAREAIEEARKPVILVGLGIEPQAPYAALRTLAESLKAPVVVTPKAKGALRDDHPLSAGTVGLTVADPVYSLIDDADLILAVGFDVVELVRPWHHDAPLIWIADRPNEDPVLPALVELVGSLDSILTRLSDVSSRISSEWGAGRVEQLHNELSARSRPQAQQGRLLPQRVLEIVRDRSEADRLLAVDVGSHKILSSLEWPALAPNRFLLSNGLSCMGYGLPAAMGAALTLSEPTLCLTGDGGLAMCLGELGILSQSRLPVTVIVLVDSALDLIRSAQIRNQRPVVGTEFRPPSFVDIGAAFGIDGACVDDEAGLTRAIDHARSTDAPYLIEVMIDPVSYPTTPQAR